MTLESLLPLLLLAQGVIGGTDTLLAPILLEWAARPTQLVAIDHGLLSWALSALALVCAAWSIRDALAWRRLRRQGGRGG